MIGVKIESIEYSLPKKVEHLKKLKKDNPQWDVKKIFSATGIKKRYISSRHEDIISLSIKSANKIFKKFPKKKIDFLIVITQTSNFRLPSASCILQNQLNLRNDIKAFDINMGCSGFIYGLNIASNLIKNQEGKNGLIICTDVYTKFIQKDNRSCRPIFSDASCSTVVSADKRNYVGPFEFGTDGKGAFDLSLKEDSKDIYMNGSRVALFSIKRVPECIKKLLKKINKNINTIDKFIFHQASKYVLDKIYKVMSIEKKKVFENYQDYGNTVSASIPIALKMASKKKFLKNNDKIILTGFGVGLSWGSVFVKWKKIN
ncbi:ketoacyl-ACP synthase III [Candidatus Pelagibacter bacterium]|nr:ketoacyl-ACP synthase III [Candidatus Pelagibacter bacterium]